MLVCCWQLHMYMCRMCTARNQLMSNGSRTTADAQTDGKDVDLDAIIKHHEKMQEKIAEEMLLLAGNLKENARAANRVVKDDVKVR